MGVFSDDTIGRIREFAAHLASQVTMLSGPAAFRALIDAAFSQDFGMPVVPESLAGDGYVFQERGLESTDLCFEACLSRIRLKEAEKRMNEVTGERVEVDVKSRYDAAIANAAKTDEKFQIAKTHAINWTFSETLRLAGNTCNIREEKDRESYSTYVATIYDGQTMRHAKFLDMVLAALGTDS